MILTFDLTKCFVSALSCQQIHLYLVSRENGIYIRFPYECLCFFSSNIHGIVLICDWNDAVSNENIERLSLKQNEEIL